MQHNLLYKNLANTYSLYLKTQCYHWNVSGESFMELHKLLETQYEELSETVDKLAERIIILGEKVPADFASFSKVSTISAGNSNFTSMEMLNDLLKDHLKMCEEIKTIIKEYENSDPATVDLLTEALSEHEKNAWFLKSFLV